jgi:predicted enzyme related to lactoylglutathione lyase
MSDYFDETADMMAASWTVGRHVSREEIIAALRAKFKTEDELRAAMTVIKADVAQTIEKIEAEGGHVVGIAQAMPKKDVH